MDIFLKTIALIFFLFFQSFEKNKRKRGHEFTLKNSVDLTEFKILTCGLITQTNIYFFLKVSFLINKYTLYQARRININ